MSGGRGNKTSSRVEVQKAGGGVKLPVEFAKPKVQPTCAMLQG
jgi:hypothetical protein